jgi:formylglycine-generating enzyme required for sulfatase activity
MKRVGRADLLVLLHGWGKEGLDQAAQLVGFDRRLKETTPEKHLKEVYAGEFAAPIGEVKVEHRFDESGLVVHFWRAKEYKEKQESEIQGDEPSWFKEEISFSNGEVRADYSQPMPAKLPLLPWSRMWPFLFGVLGCYCETRSIDMDRAVEMAARVESMSRLPFLQRLTRAWTCQVILDMDRYLLPFWDDEAGLKQGIEKLRGSSGLEVLVFENGPEGPCRRWGKELEELKPYRFPAPGSPILIISDLGCLEKNEGGKGRRVEGEKGSTRHVIGRRRREWIRFAQRLHRAGFLPTVLSLCSSRYWDTGMARYWRLVCWDRGERLPRKVDRHWSGGKPRFGTSGDEPTGAEWLLSLLSVAIRVEPALLRAVRMMLPHGVADVGDEAVVWNHENIHASPIAFAFRGESIEDYRGKFKKQADELKERVIECINKYHAHLSLAVRAVEDMIAAELLGRDVEKSWGQGFMMRVVKTQYDQTFAQQEVMGKWLDRVPSQVHPGVWEKASVLTAAWLIRNREEWEKGRLPTPHGMDPWKAAWVLGRKREPVEWVLRRKGGVFFLDRGGWFPGETADEWSDWGSPAAVLTMGYPWLKISAGGSGEEPGYVVNPEARQPVEILVPIANRVVLDTDHEQVVMESFTVLEGAIEVRCDGYGLSAVFLDDKAERRLYWLCPGKYPVFSLVKGKSKQQNLMGFHCINKGCWLDEGEFRDLVQYGFKQPGWADAIGVDRYGIYADFSIKKVIQRMRLILPGEFMMGSPANEPKRWEWEIHHKVMLTRSFWLADTACTQALWQAVMGKNPSYFKGAQRPVENVSWDNCQAFIERINALKPGLDLRLPTEAEWEYACRAGTRTPFWFGENITPEQVNYHGNYPYAGGKKGKYREETVEVKSLPCNGWGLYQMHGNVWEWCSDWFGDYPTGSVIDPGGPSNGTHRVLRGGGWIYFGRYCRSADRLRDNPAIRLTDAGLRLARGQKEEARGGGKGRIKQEKAGLSRRSAA